MRFCIRKTRPGTILLSLLRFAIYLLLPLVFLLILSVRNPQLLRLNRTSVITMSSYLLLESLFTRIYGTFKPGIVWPQSNMAAMGIASAFTNVIVYVQLQVMNVNSQNNDTLELLGIELLLLAAVFAVQLACIVALSLFGDSLYRHVHPPKRTCVIAGTQADLDIICQKLAGHTQHFTVTDRILHTDDALHMRIKASEAVLLYHLPLADHQELIAYAYKHKKALYFDRNIGNIVASHGETYKLDDVQMCAHPRNALSLSQRVCKRAMDVTVSALLLVPLAPVMLVCAIAIKLGDGGHVLYKQERVTRDARRFTMLKFRTMREHEQGKKQYSLTQDDDRVTKVGKVLRRWRLDEIPQFINILRGDMSLVGPRPEMVENVEMYTQDLPEFAYRDRVKAGLTGYAQIDGRYNTSPRDKLMMDISYIENYSILLDLKLLLKTVLVLFMPESTQGFTQPKEE